MQLKNNTPKRTSGFTLVEMIGVLAIIAILTALLIPKIFQVINDAKISNALVTYNSVKAASAAHYGKWGGFREADGTAIGSYPDEDWDAVLVSGGYLETPFTVKIGNGNQGSTANPAGARLRVLNISSLTTDSDVAADDTGAYRLSAVSPTNSTTKIDVTGSFLVEAVVPGVSLEDARELNRRVDGAAEGLGEQTWNGTTSTNVADYTGRVKYDATSANGEVTVLMYVAHR
ncbi:MAG: type II secretion system protein [Verrucomicrobiales bacterium]|nr:type II secretion system protein [Verrucomicrobiales bacterium]